MDEIHNSIDAIKSNGCDDIVLMHGIQSFPTRVEDCELNKIQTLKKEFGLPIGYADHIDADDKLMSFFNSFYSSKFRIRVHRKTYYFRQI